MYCEQEAKASLLVRACVDAHLKADSTYPQWEFGQKADCFHKRRSEIIIGH